MIDILHLKISAFLSAAIAAGAMSACAAEIKLVAPAPGATVSLLSPSEKLWREATRESRNEFLSGKTPQTRKIGRKPCPVRLEWTGTGDVFNVRVTKRGSGDAWFQAEVQTNVVEVWNLEVAKVYDWEVRGGGSCAKGTFQTEDAAPRVIVIPQSDGTVQGRNMRDIGGLVVAGRRVKQGMVFRSARLNGNAKQENGKPVAAGAPVLTKDGVSYMRERLGIKTDLDLRTDKECFGMTGSPLGEGVAWAHIPSRAYSRMFDSRGKAACGKCLRLFLDAANYPIDIHCFGGVDRTASLVVILQGILGFPEDEIWQDYQFSSSKSGFSPKVGSKWLQTFSEFLKGFDQYDGATLDERIRKYVIDLGFTEADIEKIRTILLEETFSAALASEGRVDAAKCAAETSAVGGLSCAKGGVSKAEYLDLVEAAVSAYPEDHVAEYIDDADINGVHEHGFPRLAANLAALVSAGRHRERLGQLRRMMDICCRDAKKGPMEKEGNEFSVKELVDAIRDIEAACLYPKEVTDAWRRDISEVDPWRCYRVKPEVGDTERSYNWCVFGSASEQRRLDAGMGGDAGFVARYVVDQMRWFDSNGMWRDPHEPIVYDLVTRLQFALILSSGYAGPARAELEAHLDRGAEVTLAMQSAAGEIPYGGRSNQFLHNDAMYAALCEWYAARALAKGDRQTAARFRSAAVRAVASLQRWLAERPIRHVKNRYPRSWKRGTGIGCENYAYFDKYMITMGSWAVLARRFADETPIPYVEESKAMSFATTPCFHFVFLRTGDYSAQFDYNADAHYDCDGLGRLHRRGAPTQICMSTPCAAKPNYLTETPNDGSLAIMPVGGGTLVPAGCGHDAESAWANWKVGGLDWKCRLTKYGLESSLAGEGDVALQLPAFAFDGEYETEIVNGGKSLCISYRGWVCRYETNGTVHDTGAVCCNRNGRYRVFEARGKDSLAVTICIVKSDGLSNM